MSIPSNSELALLRTQPQQTKLWLSIYNPATVLACRVNDIAIAPGARSITYDGVTAGSYVSIQNGMTLLVGTTPGGSEKGKIRVRSATSSVITVAENSHINWANNDYLTIINFYEITAIYPRIIVDPADSGSTLWYKDYDLAYTNQGNSLGSFICMGCHYAGFVGDQIYYTASGTSNVLGESLSYSWWMDGATVTGSSQETPGYFTYNTPGHYTTRLIVSGSSAGAVDVSYRHVSIYNRPEDGVNTPILRWELQDMAGQKDMGGYTARIRVYDDISYIQDNALVVIFSDNWYGETKQSIGGNARNRSSIVFCGYVIGGSITYNWRDSYAEFDVGSPTEIMKNIEGFAVAVNSSPDPSADTNPDIPSKWVLVKNMDVRRGLYHYLRWHSTVLLCNDFQFQGTDQNLEFFDSDRTSLYDAINTFIQGALYGSVTSDRQGKLWAEVDIDATDGAASAFPTTMILSNQDWMDEPNIDEKRIADVSFIEMGGVAYNPATGDNTPYLAAAPGSAPGYGGKNEQIQGLALSNQVQLNTLVGNVFAAKNCRFPSIVIKGVGNFSNLDIAPQELVKVNILSTDTVRGIAMTDKPFKINGVAWNFDPVNQILLPTMDLREVTQGFVGTTVDIPPIPPVTTEGGGGVYVPPLSIPGLPGTININMISSFNWSVVISSGATGTFSAGIVAMTEVPFNCRILSANLVATAAGNVVIDLQKCSWAAINPGTHPVAGDSIVGAGAKPTLSGAYKSSTNLAGWTTTNLSAGEWLYVYVESDDLSLVTLSISGLINT